MGAHNPPMTLLVTTVEQLETLLTAVLIRMTASESEHILNLAASLRDNIQYPSWPY